MKSACRPGRPAVLHRPDGTSGAHGIACPTPMHGRDGKALRRTVRPAGGNRDLPQRHVAAPHRAVSLRRRRRGAGAAAPRRRGFAHAAVQRSVAWPAGGGCTRPARRAPTRSARARRGTRRANSTSFEEAWPRDLPPASSTPTCSPTTCSSAARAVGPDRFLFRLHRFPRLRRRDLPERLVLRGRCRFNVTKARRCQPATASVRPLMAGRDRGAAAAGARQRAALPADPTLRLGEHAAAPW